MDNYGMYQSRGDSALNGSGRTWQEPQGMSHSHEMGYYHQEQYNSVNTSFPSSQIPPESSENSLPQFHQQGSSSQIPSNVGPERVMTRRQKASMSARESPAPPIPRASSSRIVSQDASPYVRTTSGYYVPPSASRPQTPNNLSGPTYQLQPQIQPHHTSDPNSSGMSMGSPQFPAHSPSSSVSPAYSNYGFYQHPPHSRSNSLSASTNARSASPALSIASQRTSVSSSTSSGITFASLPQVPMDNMSPTMAKPKLKKQRLFNVDRKEICEYHVANPNARQEDIAARFGVERSTISKILKQKAKWMNVPAQETIKVAKHRRVFLVSPLVVLPLFIPTRFFLSTRPSKFPAIESMLVQWLVDMTKQEILLTDNLIREQAKEVARGLDISDDKFKASSGWIENFKHRHGVKRGKWHGQGQNTMVARAMGAGALPETPALTTKEIDALNALSPLNPAFTGHKMETMDSQASPSEYGDDNMSPMEREWESQPPEVPQSPAAYGPTQTLGRAASDVQGPSHDAATSSMHQDVPQQHLEGQVQLHHPHQHANVPTGGVYENGIEAYSEPVPSLDEATVALDTLICYVKSQGDDFLTMPENDVLARLKGVLFQAGGNSYSG